jgi:hypothetical protein
LVVAAAHHRELLAAAAAQRLLLLLLLLPLLLPLPLRLPPPPPLSCSLLDPLELRRRNKSGLLNQAGFLLPGCGSKHSKKNQLRRLARLSKTSSSPPLTHLLL